MAFLPTCTYVLKEVTALWNTFNLPVFFYFHFVLTTSSNCKFQAGWKPGFDTFVFINISVCNGTMAHV